MTDRSVPAGTGDDTRTLEVSWADPRAVALRASQLSRDELLKSMVSGALPNPPIAQLLNFRVVEAEVGRVVVELVPDERHENVIGLVAGGVAASCLDAAMWIAVQSSLVDGSMVSTVNMNLHFIRRLSRESGPVRAVARTLHMGRSTATAESWLEDASGRRYAHATASFLRMGVADDHR
ncbi:MULTISPECIES: PaaI family thioesterase [unclassified Streptosporangium]|uniref:PaaI family thioesterase n=1 Tax=unclassified Streptosporangium TaxID=2632669 RepID=UPI002E2B155D|nr:MULTISPECIES: PaaI family thioesterase [unclassified Streptosporangium]